MRLRNIIIQCLVLLCYTNVLAQEGAGSSIVSRTKLAKRGTKAIEQRIYDNGLGDIVQEIQSYKGSTLPSVIVHHEYDKLRRETKTWLPVTSSSTTGEYTSKNNIAYLANSRYRDAVPFSYTEYDDFLLAQPSGQHKAGEQWQDKKVSVTYIDTLTTGVILLDDGQLYAYQVQYFCTKYVDEDGIKRLEYTDLRGQLKISENSQGRTYYVYNPKGDLSYVFPPAISNDYIYEDAEISEEDEVIQKYAYVYHYDNQHRCTYKKLPGCDPIYYVYDKAGNCIFSQDGNQRKRGEWAYSIPDKLNRPCINGICKNSMNYSKEPLRTKYIYVEYDGTTNSTGGYKINNITLSSPTLYSAVYYDNFSFIGKNSVPTSLKSSNTSSIDSSIGRGLQTGTATAILKNGSVSGYTYSAMYYDSRYNVVEVISTNHLGGRESISTSYTYTGKPKVVEISRNQRQIGDFERYNYYYDNADRIEEITHYIGNVTKTIQKNEYNALGQLSSVTTGSHRTSYAYDIHSWLTNISSSNRSNIFDEKLMYANSDKPCYNGNISAMSWSTNGATRKNYTFEYDGVSRLIKAEYSEGSNKNSNVNNFNTQYKYDCMGNITSIIRNGKQDGGTYGAIDKLTLSYVGNRLTKVKDAVTDPTYKNAFNFVDGTNNSKEYTYDNNGNVISDKNKGIESILYNSLNLPYKISFTGGNSIMYTYSADGRKLRAEYITNIPYTRKTIDYCGNIIYEDGKSKQLNFDGGYIPLEDLSMAHRYYVKDHLGNNRMVVHESGTVEQINEYYPFGGLMANSTGDGVQRYKYNGKEFDRMHGLDWYDYGARWMDPAIGRWHSIDPLCEKYYNVSPYAYCTNNPVMLIDPDGRDVYLFATKLPSDWKNLVGAATHTFLVVTNKSGEVVRYAAFGPENNWPLGYDNLSECHYDQDINVYNDYFAGEKNDDMKSCQRVPVPEGMTSEEFDKNVIRTINSFGKCKGIYYNILPCGDDEGNCNSSSSTVLIKAGVSKDTMKELKENIPGIKTGFETSTTKPWTKEEQKKVAYKRQIETGVD